MSPVGVLVVRAWVAEDGALRTRLMSTISLSDDEPDLQRVVSVDDLHHHIDQWLMRVQAQQALAD